MIINAMMNHDETILTNEKNQDDHNADFESFPVVRPIYVESKQCSTFLQTST